MPACLLFRCNFHFKCVLLLCITQVTVSESGSISSQLTSSTFYGLIKLLATCASGSHVVAESLLQGGVSRTLRTLLTTSPLLTTSGASPGNALRSADQLQGLVALATQLLPPVPDASAAVLAVTPSGDLLGDAKEEGPETVGSSSAALSAYLQQNPEVADRVASDLLPVMLRVYTASVTPQVKRQSLGALVRMVYHAPVPTLSTLLSDLPVSSLVAMLLRSSDAGVVAQGMQLAEILMGKLPEVFTKFFLKEGVVQAMEDLAATAPAAATSTPGSDGGLRTRSGRVTRSRSQVEEVAPPPAPPAEMQTPAGTTLRTALATHARRFCARYFIDDNGNPMGKSNICQ